MMRLFRIILALLAAQTMFAQQPARTRIPSDLLQDIGLDQKLDTQVPLSLTFTDEAGKQVRLADYFGRKPVVLSLVYYQCPMLCTQILTGMVMSFRQLPFEVGSEFEVVTVSINPGETPELAREKKQTYLEEYAHPRSAAAAGWHFLTGTEASIKTLADSVGYHYVYDAETQQYAHPSGIIVLTPAGRIARYLYGIEYPSRDLKFALVEASNNRIGSPVDKILLLCYHYDPMTGTYGVVVMNLLRGGAVLMLVLLGVFWLVMFRREKKKRSAIAMEQTPSLEKEELRSTGEKNTNGHRTKTFNSSGPET
jgi:protein SCO1/2